MSKSLTEDEKLLLLAEYEPLREEVNRTVDRMTSNELACSAFVFSVVLFQLSFSNATPIPDWLVVPFGGSLALIAAFLGYERSKVFRRHMDQVDSYLANLESQFSGTFGWTNHYRSTMGTSDAARQTGTRVILWHLLRFVALANFVLQTAAVVLDAPPS